MNIILSNTDSAPIYEQITRQLRAKIVSGELTAGQALPSMRLLARELRISVITTKRAYEELEREGLIVTQTGRGSFVAQVSGARLREEQLRARGGASGAGGTRGEAGRTDREGVHGDRTNGF